MLLLSVGSLAGTAFPDGTHDVDCAYLLTKPFLLMSRFALPGKARAVLWAMSYLYCF